MLPFAPSLVAAALAASPVLAAGESLTLAFSQASYLPGQEVVLTIDGPTGLATFLLLDTVPGPTEIPGVGIFDLGFSSDFLFLPLGLLPEDGITLTYAFVCGRPAVGATTYAQAVGIDTATLAIQISNSDSLTIYDACDGCTPGYWKSHPESWADAGYAPEQDFDTVFGVDAFDPDVSLLAAASLEGGQLAALARHAVAALLSAGDPDVDFQLTEAEVVGLVQSALADGGDVEGTKNLLAMLNELGCPL
ncbi:MAG TPA: hypothetical protein VJP77_03290 [Planctomycetota bacterium]|nr:hypothetical protein [Planctomycetota bacterium]